MRKADRNADDLTERLRHDRVWAAAQVMVLVKIMLTVLLLDPRSFDTFTLPKSVAAHATSLVIAALLLWLVARYGRSVLVWSPIHVGVGALLLAFAIATPFALDPMTALFGTFKRYLGLTQMLDNVLLYLSVTILFRDLRSLRLLAGAGIGVVVPVLVYALIQRLELDPLRFQGGTRIPISTLGNPDITGGFVSILGVTALGLGLLMGGRLITWQRMLLGLIGIGCVGILYTTGVRAGALAIAGGWLITILLTFRLPHGRTRTLSALGIAVLLGLGIAASPVGARLAPDVLRADVAAISRLEMWRAGAEALLDRPVLGYGPDNFAVVYPSHRTQWSITTGELQNSTHDVWLYAATSAGIVGLAALLLLVVLSVDRGLRLAGRGHPAAFALLPLVAYLSQALVNVNEIAIDWTFWISVGVIAAASGSPLPVPRRRRGASAANAVGVAALAGAALIALTTLLPRVGAGEAMQGSEAFTEAGRAPEAVPYGEMAVTADPRRAELWSSYGRALHDATARAAAVTAFETAARLKPHHPLSWKNLAIGWRDLGNGGAAYAAARRIPLADPFDGEGRELLATVAYESGDFARAATEGEKAIAYEREARASAYFTTTSAYVQLKDLDRAEVLAREGATRFPAAQLRLQLAAVLADRGKKAEAISVLDALLQEEPRNNDAQQLRAAILRG